LKIVREVQFDDRFGSSSDECGRNSVFQIFPEFHVDDRGHFMEVIRDSGEHWIRNFSWMRQMNRSSSRSCVLRGCHAQRGAMCQGKLVEAVNRTIYDIITDARPNSESFGVTSIYRLDPGVHNQLWIPRGFLHAFVVPDSETAESEAVFQYYVDNAYDKTSEICVNPKSFLGSLMACHKSLYQDLDGSDFDSLHELFTGEERLIISDKDLSGVDYNGFMMSVKREYETSGKLWYR